MSLLPALQDSRRSVGFSSLDPDRTIRHQFRQPALQVFRPVVATNGELMTAAVAAARFPNYNVHAVLLMLCAEFSLGYARNMSAMLTITQAQSASFRERGAGFLAITLLSSSADGSNW
jgi:hypothetical protein